MLEYFIQGESNPETILFVHGAGSNAHQFDAQLTFFSNHYQVVSVSLRGHGGSKAPEMLTAESYSLQENANDIIDLIQKLDLRRIHYVGNSAGGVLGYLICSTMQDRFLSLTTFGTTGRMNLPNALGLLVSNIDAFMIKRNVEKYLRYIANHTGITPESRNAIYNLFQKATDAIPHIRRTLARYDYLKEIEHMSIPYTLIQCEHDKEINNTLKPTLAAISKNKNAKVVILNGAGHIANLDAPDSFNQLLQDILSNRQPQHVEGSLLRK